MEKTDPLPPNNSKIKLAVEGGLTEGSLAVWSDGEFVDGFWLDGQRVQSEILLKSIEQIFIANDLKKTAVEQIVCAAEIGSATGNRVAAAAALGLQTAFECQIIFASVLETALRHYAADIFPDREIIVCAASRQMIFAQKVKKSNQKKNVLEFSSVVENAGFFQWLGQTADQSPRGAKKSESSENINFIEYSRDLETVEAIICLNEFDKFAEHADQFHFKKMRAAAMLPACYLGEEISKVSGAKVIG